MSNEKLSELSKPEQFNAEVEIHGGEPFAVWAPAVNGSHVKAEHYFALLAELEAKDKRISELEAKTSMTMGVGDGSGSLFVHGDYDSIKAAQRIVLESEELRAKLATPVRLPKEIEPTFEAICEVIPTANPDEYACCIGADMWNGAVKKCRKLLLKQGFTVEGGE